jgi:uncharacterized membrane protein YdjX (TVP38/TMEM64 family)
MSGSAGRRLALLAGIGLAAFALFRSGALDLVTDRERASATLQALGVWGPVLFVLAFALLEPFGVPAAAFIFPAALVWPAGQAFLLSLVGGTLAALVGFGFARYLARDWVEARLPPSLRRFDDRLAARGFQTVVLIRVMLLMSPPTHWVMGVSRVRTLPYTAGTVLVLAGYAGTVAFLGGRLASWLEGQPLDVWAGVGVLALAFLLLRLRARRARRIAEPESI